MAGQEENRRKNLEYSVEACPAWTGDSIHLSRFSNAFRFSKFDQKAVEQSQAFFNVGDIFKVCLFINWFIK